jgi:hypothetical protein
MNVEPFLDGYPVSVEPRVTAYDTVNQAHKALIYSGRTLLKLIQGEVPPRDELETLQPRYLDVPSRAMRHALSTTTDPDEATEIDHARTEYRTNEHIAMMYPQINLLFPGAGSRDFNDANTRTSNMLALFAMSLIARQANGIERQGNVRSYQKFDSQAGYVTGRLNEFDTAIALLGIARKRFHQDGRRLVVLPAPAQMSSRVRRVSDDGDNKRLDFIVMDVTDRDNAQAIGVQTSATMHEDRGLEYDRKKMMLVCGSSDFGNYIYEDGTKYNYSGRLAHNRLRELFSSQKTIIRVADQGALQVTFIQEVLAQYKAARVKPPKNLKMNVIYQMLGDRLDRQFAVGAPQETS